MREKSCGTIIIDNNKVLIIKQKQGFYGFVKGHMEENETEIETAIRETKEETNLDVLIYETKRYSVNYKVNNKINKEVIYYLAKPITKNIKKQESEINEILWVDIDKVIDILTYNNIKNMWKKVLKDIKNDEF